MVVSPCSKRLACEALSCEVLIVWQEVSWVRTDERSVMVRILHYELDRQLAYEVAVQVIRIHLKRILFLNLDACRIISEDHVLNLLYVCNCKI